MIERVPLPGDGLEPATAAKYGKVPVAEGCICRFPRALLEVAKVSVPGSAKHGVPTSSMSYLDVPEAEWVYRNAEARHLIAEMLNGPVNKEDWGLYHKAQKAWNALADLEVFLKLKETEHGKQ